MCKPDSLNIFLRSKSLAGEVTETEEWYSTKHSVHPIPESLIAKMVNPKCEIKSKKLGLPPANTLIPKNFNVLPENAAHSATPILLKKWADTDLWYKKDDKFLRPKAIVNLKIYTTDNNFGSTIEARMFANVWKDVAEEAMREFNYTATCANLNFDASLLHDNINLSWSGFDDSMPNYITETISRL